MNRLLARSFAYFVVAFLVVGSICGTASGQDVLAEAQKLLDEGKFQEAADKFSAGLKVEGKAIEARIGLARAYIGLEEFETANFHAVKAEKLDPKNAVACEMAGLTFRRIGDNKLAAQEDPRADFEYAAESFTRARAADPKSVVYCVNLGYLYFQLSKFADAAKAFEAAAENDPKNIQHYMDAAQCWGRAENGDAATKIVDKAIALNPENTSLRLSKGNALLAAGKKGDAADAFAEALMAKTEKKDHIVPAAQGIWRSFFEEKNFAAMESRFQQWVKARPEEPEALWWLGFVQMKGEKAEDALETFQRYDKLTGAKLGEGPFRIGEAEAALGKWEEAAKSYVTAWERGGNWGGNDPSHSPIFQLDALSGQLFAKNDFENAVLVCEKFLLPICPEGRKFQIYQNAGFFCREWGTAIQRSDKDKALQVWKKGTNFYEKSCETMEKADAITPTNKAQIVNDTGLMYHYHFEDYDKAMKFYKKALAFDPNFGDAMLNIGRVYNRLGKYQDAIDVLEKGPKERADIQMELRQARQKLEKEKKG